MSMPIPIIRTLAILNYILLHNANIHYPIQFKFHRYIDLLQQHKKDDTERRIIFGMSYILLLYSKYILRHNKSVLFYNQISAQCILLFRSFFILYNFERNCIKILNL